MRSRLRLRGASILLVLFLMTPSARGESHRATRLGNPATRFAPRIHTTEELRSRFADSQLRADMISVLRQWGWQGDPNDLFAAAAKAEVVERPLAVGQVMPFMASRENGHPICLRNVTWAGKEPEPALAFLFSSRGQRYRCVTPKACSNFFVEALGPDARHELALDCSLTNQVLVGRKVEVCLTVRNNGNVPERAAILLAFPADAAITAATSGAQETNNAVQWAIADLPAGAARQYCAVFRTQKPGALKFAARLSGSNGQASQTACETTVLGVSALLLEKADDPDPVSIGETTTYTVKVTNQGTAEDTAVKVVVEFPEELDPVAASNGGEIAGKVVTFPAYERLAPKEAFEYSVRAKGVKAGDARVRFVRTSTDIPAPTTAEESTRTY